MGRIAELRSWLFGFLLRPIEAQAVRGMHGIPGMNMVYRGLVRYLVPGGIGTVKYDGFVLDIYRRGYPKMLIGDGRKYTPAETLSFKSLIKEGMTVVTVGAAVGYYTLVAARLVGPKGKVYAFEPFPEAFGLLTKNVERSGYKNVIMVNEAVADYVGFTNLYLLDSNPLGNSLSQSRETVNYIEVPTTTLDAYFGNEKIDVIRSVAEGSDMMIVKGMRQVIKNNPNLVVQIEVDPSSLAGLGHTVREYVDALLENFNIRVIKHRSDTIEDYRDIRQIIDSLTYKYGGTQLVCTRKKAKL